LDADGEVVRGAFFGQIRGGEHPQW
jgi:hypothetical protein